MKKRVHLPIATGKILKILFSIEVVLIFAHLAVLLQQHFRFLDRDFKQIIRFFHLESEGNLPTLFSSFLLFTSSVLLFLIYFSEKNSERKNHEWCVLGLIFLYLGLDEGAQIHEMINVFFRGILPAKGIFFHAWVIPFGIVFLILAGYFFPFLRQLEKRHQQLFFLSGFLYVLGGFFMEMWSGYRLDNYGFDFGYGLINTLEEVLEMTGISLFIYSLTDYIKSFKLSFLIS